eukprot:6199140-Pleurochrysis_carterae.AAC.1
MQGNVTLFCSSARVAFNYPTWRSLALCGTGRVRNIDSTSHFLLQSCNVARIWCASNRALVARSCESRFIL